MTDTEYNERLHATMREKDPEATDLYDLFEEQPNLRRLLIKIMGQDHKLTKELKELDREVYLLRSEIAMLRGSMGI